MPANTSNTPPAAVERRSDYEITAEQIHTTAQGSPANLLSGIAAGALLSLGATYGDASLDRVLLVASWLGFLTLFLLLGVYLARKISRRPLEDARHAHRVGKWFVVNGAVCAIVWGSAAWVFLPASSSENELFVLVGTAMVLVGGAAAQACYRPLVQTFTTVLVVTFSLGLVTHGERFYLLYAAAFALLWLVTLMASRNQERSLRYQIMFRMERDSLAKSAEEARRQSELARVDAERAREDSDNARKDAELANRAKTVFLTAATHDLRQPMHALGLYLDSLQRYNEDPHLQQQIHLCDKALDALKSLLDSMLDISRIAAGTLRPQRSRTKMNAVLERVDAQLRPSAIDKRLYFDVGRTPACVYTDAGLLERILVNLTQNAIRYTEKGRVLVRCKARGDYLRCYVVDTGIGIPKAELSNIYEPFYQVANRARDRRKGLGMGLAIVRQLSDILRYQIRVRSVVGKGTLFSIDVPIAQAGDDEQAPQGTEISHDYVKGAFVVVIDNDEQDLHATATTLREFGCRVLSTSSGQSAVAKLQGRERPPDLILADYRLENETGLQAISAITDNLKAAFGDRLSIPAIVVSGDTSPEILTKVQEHAFDMLHKPVRRRELWDAMNVALTSRSTDVLA